MDFLRLFRSKVNPGTVYFCLDNLRVHYCKAVKEYCEANQIELVYTPPYSSSFACIERLWAIPKNIFRKKILLCDKKHLTQE